MFFYDNNLRVYEQKHEFCALLNYLIQLYVAKSNVQLLTTIIAYSWYLSTSHEYDNEVNYDYDKFIMLWSEYIDKGKISYPDDPGFNFVAGYTLGLHYFYVRSYRHDEKEYWIFIRKAYLQNTNMKVKLLAENFIANDERHKIIPLNNNEIVYSLFPNTSLLDNYFKEIYLS